MRILKKLAGNRVPAPRPLPEDQGPDPPQPVEPDPRPAASRAISSSASPATTPAIDRLATKVIYTDALAFIVSPAHRLAKRRSVSIAELGKETFIAHNVLSPYRDVVLREFRRHKVPLNMDVEMPTLETIRRLVQNGEGVAFLPRMCVRQDVETGAVREVTVKELHVERKVRLLYVKARTLSHAAKAFLDLVAAQLDRAAFRLQVRAWRDVMLWTIAVIMLVLWLLGLVTLVHAGRLHSPAARRGRSCWWRCG